MDLRLDADWLLRYLLVVTRLSGLFVLSPVLGMNQAPMRVRLMVVLVLSFVFSLSLPAGVVPIDTTVQLLIAALRELLVGALIGLGIHTVFAALALAGQLLDYQTGFNASALFDRNTQAQSPLLTIFLGMAGGVVFLTLDAHHLLLRAIGQTLATFPVGERAFAASPGLLTRELGLVFLFGLALAGPVALGLFLLDLATAFVSRSMPQLNIYFVSLPLKIFWGVFLLTVALSYMGPLMQRLFSAAISASIRH